MLAHPPAWLLMLLLLAWPDSRTLAQSPSPCHNVRVNARTNGAALLVGTTAVTIAEAHPDRCALIIVNETQSPMRCAPASGPYALAVSRTVGMLIPPGLYPVLGPAGQQAWACVRTGSYDVRLSIGEELP